MCCSDKEEICSISGNCIEACESVCARTYAYTRTHTLAHMCAHIHTHTHSNGNIDTLTYTLRHEHKHTKRNRNTHTHTHTHTHTNARTPAQASCCTYRRMHASVTYTHTHTHTSKQAHKQTNTQTHKHTKTHTHTHTHTYKHIHCIQDSCTVFALYTHLYKKSEMWHKFHFLIFISSKNQNELPKYATFQQQKLNKIYTPKKYRPCAVSREFFISRWLRWQGRALSWSGHVPPCTETHFSQVLFCEYCFSFLLCILVRTRLKWSVLLAHKLFFPRIFWFVWISCLFLWNIIASWSGHALARICVHRNSFLPELVLYIILFPKQIFSYIWLLPTHESSKVRNHESTTLCFCFQMSVRVRYTHDWVWIFTSEGSAFLFLFSFLF